MGREKNFMKFHNFDRVVFVEQLNKKSTNYHIDLDEFDPVAGQTVAIRLPPYIAFMKKSMSDLIKYYQLVDTIFDRNESFHEFKSTILDILWIFETMNSLLQVS